MRGPKAWLAICALVLASCGQPVTPTSVSACAAFCGAAKDMGCSEGGESPGGVPCVAWCENYHARGYLRPFSECGAVAVDVDAMRACGVSCEQ